MSSKEVTQSKNKAASWTALQAGIAAPVAAALAGAPIFEALNISEVQIAAAIAAVVGFLLSYIKSDIVVRKNQVKEDYSDFGFD